MPFSSVRFIFYFTVIVFGIGGIGHWINFFKKVPDEEFFYSLATFALTLASASFADVTLKKNIGNSDDVFNDDLPDIVIFPYTCFFIIIFLCAFVGLILCGFTFNVVFPLIDKETGILLSKVSFALSLFFWWQVNSKNPKLSNTNIDPWNTYGDSEQINPDKKSEYHV